MFSALKAEISSKKRSLEDTQVITGDKKYFKRKDLATIQAQISKDEQDASCSNKKLKSPNKNPVKSNDEMDEGPELPRAEVIRRLREREEPIMLFGELDNDAFRRLRRLEILEPEVNRGLRNDFQEALERVDEAYMNEILKTEDGDGPQDVALIGESISMEGLKALSENLSADNTELSCKVILQFVQLLLQVWGKRLNSRPESEKTSVRGKKESATYTQTSCYLKPLTKRLKKRTLPEDILECLTEIVVHCLDRDYVKANDAYLQMAIGNAPWPIGVTMVGIHARTGREKIFSKHVAHVLNDETQRKYIQGLKRLMTKCQSYYPADPSKCVEYKALPQT